jgi:OmpA-OmpF porin, OOP family
MKKQLIAMAVAAASLFGAQAAMAQGYVGVSGGASFYDVDCAGTTSCDKNDTSLKLFGGYNINPNFAIEGGYTSLGKAKASIGPLRAELKATGFEVAGVGKFPAAQNLELFVKLGVSVMTGEAVITGPVGGSAEEDSAELLAGIGLSYALNKQVALRAEYETRNVKFPGDKATVGNFTVGVTFKF